MLTSYVMRRSVEGKNGYVLEIYARWFKVSFQLREYFALDLGGTNFRVLKLTLKDSKVSFGWLK